MKKIAALVFVLQLSISAILAQNVPGLEWARVFSGTLSEIPTGIATDPSGNVYTTGSFNGTTDFDPGAGIFTLTSAGSQDIFISKIDANGNFVWAKSIGGTDTDNGFAIAVDAAGNVYTTGHFNNTVDFDPGTGIFNITSLGSADIFVSKLDTDGNFVWAKSVGGTDYQHANAITIDGAGNVYTTGYFFGATDFDPGAGTFTLTPLAAEDVFILKLDNNGDFVWAQSFEGNSTERGKGIAVDGSGHVYTTGYIFNGTMDLDPGVGVLGLTTTSFRSMFISKLDATGSFVWGKAIADVTSIIESESLTLDNSGNLLITGSFSGVADFDTGAGIVNLTADSGSSIADIFIVKLDTNGDLVWAKSIGPNSNYQIGTSIITDVLDNVYTTGRFAGVTDFDPGAGTFNLTPAGGPDVFVSSLDATGNFLWAVRVGGSGASGETGNSITIDALGNVHVAGSFFSPTVDFDFGACVLNIANTGFGDGFIEKISLGPAIPPPTITSFSLSSGSVGTTVTLTGTNFSSIPANNQVAFFNNQVATVTASTPTSITTSVPVGATSGKISVTVGCVTATSATDFTVTNNFVTRWNLATAGSGATQLTFGTATSGTVSYSWQEISPGTASGSGSWSGATLTLTGLPTGATIRLQITPTNFQRIIINTGADRNRLTRVEQWGTTVWSSMQNAFRGCANLQVTATDIPDLSGLSDLSGMFSLCTTLNSPNNIGSWNTSAVTNMSALFSQASAFNQNIGSWNTGAVTNMSSLFADAGAFNQDIGAWNTSAVTNMAGMFAGAIVFNRNIGGWNTAAVTNMNSMFFSAYAFNQNIGGWNTAAVTNMGSMFGYAYNFNQNIGTWNTAAVTNMSRMFEDAFDFNQNIGTWNTAAVTNMNGMFIDAYAFNQNIGTWNTAAVTNLSRMFDFATAFNQNIGAWNTAAVTNMSGMFADASAFNQNLGTWTLNPAVNLSNLLNNSGMNCDNYSATLLGWSANPTTPNGRTMAATGRQYGTNAVAARTNLTTTKGWTITGDTPSGATCVAPSAPTITSFTPNSGPVGATVTITGTNFSTTAANNIVSFNGTMTVATASTATSITVTVPPVATTGPVAVTVASTTAVSSTNFTVTAAPVIIITIQPSDFITCSGPIATFTTAATGTTNITYQWQFSTTVAGTYNDIYNASGYSNVTTASLSVNTIGNFGAGFYRCKVNGDLASTVFSNVAQLTVNATPVAPTATPATSCTPAALTLSAAGGVDGQYRWYDVATGGTAFPGEVNSNYTTPVLSSTQVYYVAIDDGTCASNRTAVAASIGPITPTTTSASSCGDGTVMLAASGGVNGQYRWYTVASGGTPVSGETSNTYTTPLLSATTTYYVSIDNGSCEGARTPAVASIFPVPSTPNGISASNCGPGSVVLSATGGTNGQYRWYDVATGGTAFPGEDTESYTTPAITTTTAYYVALNDGTCESLRATVSAQINTTPASPAATNGSSCGAAAVTLGASGAANGEYRWYTVATGGTALAGEVNDFYTTPVISATTTYYVAINNGTCEGARTSVVATINNPPARPNIALSGAASFCQGGSVTLSVPVASSYLWSSGETNQQITVSSSGTFSVSITDANGCTSPTADPVVISVNALPAKPLVTTSGATTFCEGGSVILSTPAGFAYAWSNGVTTDQNTITSSGTYSVTITDSNGCSSVSSDPVSVTVNPAPPKPVVTASGSVTLCTGQSVVLSAPAGFTYLWSNAATSQQVIISASGSYTVQVTDANSCTSIASDAVAVAVSVCNLPPAISSATAQTRLEGSLTLDLTTLLSDPDNNLDLATLRIVGQPTSGAVASINTNFELVVNYQGVSFTGDDFITIEVCDVAGECVQQLITIEVVGDIVVMNGLSPNGDNVNDFLEIKYIDLFATTRDNRVTIYNRWGDVVFETDNYDNTSNVFRGRSKNGSELPSGTYLYKIVFKDGLRSPETGYLVLKR